MNKEFLKNFIGFVVLALIIFMVFLFRFKIKFTVFENILK